MTANFISPSLGTLTASEARQLVVLHSAPIWLPQTQTWMYNQIRYLPDRIKSHIVCETTQNLEQFALPNVHALETASKWRYLWDKSLRRLKVRPYLGFEVAIAKQQRAKILHSHFGQIGWTNINVARKAGLKHVVTFYGQDVTYIPKLDHRWYRRYRDLFASVDRVLCEGPHMAVCVTALGCPPEKVKVHHLGVSIDTIAYQPRMWRPGETLRVLIAASFREKKGIPDGLKALGHLQHDVPLAITIIGDAASEPRAQAEKQAILATIDQYQLQSKVRLLGYQSHSTFFKECYDHHLFLSPSVTASDGDTEGGAPVSLIEAAATGMSIISTTHCDIPEVIEHGATGLLAGEHCVDELVQHLRWFVQHPDQWQAIVQSGRQHVEQEFDAQVQGQRLAAIYAELQPAFDTV